MERHELKQNSRKIRKLEIALAVFALTFYALCIASAAAWADTREVAALGPRDALKPLKPEVHNGDYLKELSAPPAEQNLNSAIFDKEISNEMTEKFNAFDVTYQHKMNYQLDDRADYLMYEKSNKDLAEWTIKKLLQYHFEHTIERNVEKAAKRMAQEPAKKNGSNSGERTAAKAVVALSGVSKAIRNTTLNIGKDTKTRFRYDFPSGLMRVGMTSPIVDATMDYRIRPADPTIGAVSQPEKLSLGVTKNLTDLRANTGVTYGLLSETLNYGVNKHLFGPVSAQVDQAHNIRDNSKDETLFRLNLGTRF